MVNRNHDGAPLAGKIRSAWDGILEDAGLGGDVVRHSLRHTAATWLMQRGTDRWEAAGWLGMTLEQLANRCRVDVVAPLIEKLVGMVPKLRDKPSE